MGSSPLSWISVVVTDEQCHQLLAAGLVDLVKAADKRAVEVEDTRDVPALQQRHHQLASISARQIDRLVLRDIAHRPHEIREPPDAIRIVEKRVLYRGTSV